MNSRPQLRKLFRRLATLMDATRDVKHPPGPIPSPPPPGPTPPPPGPTPPPPPAAPGDVGTFMVRNASAGPTPFAGVHVFDEGLVTDPATLVATDEPNIQFVPWNYWPDGSLRDCHVGGVTTLTANTPKTITIRNDGPASGTNLTAAQLQASGLTVAFTTSFGNVTFSGTDWLSPVQTWVQGPKLLLAQYYKAIGGSAHLGAWVWVFFYGAGVQSRVIPVIENGWLLEPGPTSHSGTFAVSINGSQVFNESVALPHHGRTPLVKDKLWYSSGGADHQCMFKQNRTELEKTGFALSRVISLPDNYTGGSQSPMLTSFTPLQLGLFNTSMSGGGDHTNLGIETGYDADYLACDGLQTWKSMCWQGYSWGRYPVHHRDKATNKPFRFSQRPGVISSGAGINALEGAENTVQGIYQPIPDGSGIQPDNVDIAHQPRGPFLPWRSTGLPYFLEELQFLANTNFIMYGRARGEAQCLIIMRALQTRAMAWGSRALIEAAAVCKHDDPLRLEYEASIDANVEFYDLQQRNEFGLLPNSFDGEYKQLAIQPFQADFLASAWGRGVIYKVGSTQAIRDKLRNFYDWLARATVSRFGALDSTTDIPFSHASMQYYKAAGTLYPGSPVFVYGTGPGVLTPGLDPLQTNFEDGSGPWHASYRAMHDALFAGPNNPAPTGIIYSDALGDPGGVWGPAMCSLAINHFLGGPKAMPGYLRVRGVPDDAFYQACVSGQSIKYAAIPLYTEDDLDVPASEWATAIPAAGQRININLNGLNDELGVDPEAGIAQATNWWNGYQPQNIVTSLSGAWNWGVQVNEWGDKGAILMYGGGHGAATANVTAIFDFDTRLWSTVGFAQNVPATEAWTGFGNLKVNDRTNYVQANDQRDSTWMDYPYTTAFGTSYILLNAHMYLHMEYAPSSATNGSKGSLVIGHLQWSNDPSDTVPPKYSQYPAIAHQMDLATGLIKRGTSTAPITQGAAESNAFVRDTKRNRLWHFYQQRSIAYYYDLAEPAPRVRKEVAIGTVPGGPPEIGVSSFAMLYVEEMDAILAVGGNNAAGSQMGCYWIDMRTGFPVMESYAYAPPNRVAPMGGKMVGVAYEPTLKAFYFYEGRQTTTCEVLQLSTTDLKTTTYSWRKESFTGPTPPGQLQGAITDDLYYSELYSPGRRWMYVKALGCFAWVNGTSPPNPSVDGVSRTGTVQLWKAPGVVV
jgi:hypothetical protein